MAASIEKIAGIAQDELDKENASDPVVKKSLHIVETFIKTHRVMCYGGTAINNLLPPEDRFYDPDRDIPDYDFFSETPQLHAAKLADRLVKAGFNSVEVKPGVHLGTFKVFCEYIGVADISHLDKSIFKKLWSESIEKENIHYVPPNFLRMAVYLELSRPKGDVSRWKKVYTRLMLLNKHHPMTCPASQKEINGIFLPKDIKNRLENLLVKEKVILLGFNASELQKKDTDKWMLPLDLLVVPEKRKEFSTKVSDLFGIKLNVKEIDAYGELLPAHTDIDDPKTGKTLVRVYETDACHSYHQEKGGLMVASIPTLLQFFLAVLYAPKHFLEEVPEQRFLCTAQKLIEMANSNFSRRYKLLTPITCLGKQKSLIDMRVQKSELFAKLSKDRSSPEYLEYFFTYVPTSMDKTKRNTFRKEMRKTLKNTK